MREWRNTSRTSSAARRSAQPATASARSARAIHAHRGTQRARCAKGARCEAAPDNRTRGLRGGVGLAALLQQLGDEASPARLVAGADPAAGVAVEILVEEHEVAPVGIVAKARDVAV